MKIVAVVQARMNSTRLPGKVMLPLDGEPMIYRLLERVRRCRELDNVILAVGKGDAQSNDYSLISQAIRLHHQYDDALPNIQVRVDDETEDCLARTYRAAENFDIIVRIPGDNPCVDPAEISRIIARFKSHGEPCFASNIRSIGDNGYPDGIGAEVFTIGMLEEAYYKNHDQPYREHVHLNWFDYDTQQRMSDYPVVTVPAPRQIAFPQLRLDVNDRRDYTFMARLYDDIHPNNPTFSTADILEWLRDRTKARRLLEQSLYPGEPSVH